LGKNNNENRRGPTNIVGCLRLPSKKRSEKRLFSNLSFILHEEGRNDPKTEVEIPVAGITLIKIGAVVTDVDVVPDAVAEVAPGAIPCTGPPGAAANFYSFGFHFLTFLLLTIRKPR